MPSAAQRLCRDVVADPHGPLVAAVAGPGGCGKTAMLETLARIYRDAGVPVVHEYTEDASAALLVDDAHGLDDVTLDRLRRLAVARSHRMVVAYRPWPRPHALSALGAVLVRCRPPVVLGRLDRAAVATARRTSSDTRPPTRSPTSCSSRPAACRRWWTGSSSRCRRPVSSPTAGSPVRW
ncbi:hypothetical protein FXN61_20050 [Lentzea sp. PSKA42]|uniref:AAA domain-containing protein n=1 Tax=Lentzea indica TaxID=2604800 RepID=A0ABX1FJT4_9PSEU|nr:hypothetical protein [Lentzea indica]NKE58976.1 hypothetical protein [Lentzea indica]